MSEFKDIWDDYIDQKKIIEQLEQQLQQKEEQLISAIELMDDMLNAVMVIFSNEYEYKIEKFKESLKTTKEPHESEQKRP